ncbi:MAG TPA: UdgX family uracil-DNA binding protein [Blastocatellia bacterium]|nr:UdgX family uracil-DNA binding protein [Blastocatellia bacterium]
MSVRDEYFKDVSSAEELIDGNNDLDSLRDAASVCRACNLWKLGTQTVFGEGNTSSKIVFVGEQPGNDEDLSGRPFVGPAGKLLQKALVDAGINRADVYVTNVVKHFNWEPRGKRRIHKRPNGLQVAACQPWLDAEIRAIKPGIVVCLGATAAQSLLGQDFKVTKRRGEVIKSEHGYSIVATIHPSAILRTLDDQARRDELKRFVDDLKKIATLL